MKNAKDIINSTTYPLQTEIAMNVIGEFQKIINECQNYFFVIGDTSFCKGYIVKSVVSLNWIQPRWKTMDDRKFKCRVTDNTN